MSTSDDVPETQTERAPCPSVSLSIQGRPRNLGGGFMVRRLLPSIERRMVGPFLFFDHMGPVALPVGEGMDVRPHPHIALATVTYLFDGEIMHRDSLGSHQAIRPGDVNWMVAGRGIVHSERSSEQGRAEGVRLHGIQSWVALPIAHEETAPSFQHHPRATLPNITVEDAQIDVIAGTAFGARSPVEVFSPTFYAHARLRNGGSFAVDDEHEERALYVVEGEVTVDGQLFAEGSLLVLTPGTKPRITSQGESRLMLLGGAKLDGPRHMFWNFVASSKERIEQAKEDWKAGRFPTVPGDDREFIPLPEG